MNVIYQCFPVWLVYSVLHCLVYQLWIRGGLREGGGQHSQPLQIEDLRRRMRITRVW